MAEGDAVADESPAAELGDGVGPASGSLPSDVHPASEERGRGQRERASHWLVLAQQTDRRLPASHSASWNQV